MISKVLFALILLLGAVRTYRIIVAIPSIPKSHYQFGNALSKGLVAFGHEVTVITPYKEQNPPTNYNEVYLEHTEQAVNASNIFEIDMSHF